MSKRTFDIRTVTVSDDEVARAINAIHPSDRISMYMGAPGYKSLVYREWNEEESMPDTQFSISFVSGANNFQNAFDYNQFLENILDQQVQVDVDIEINGILNTFTTGTFTAQPSSTPPKIDALSYRGRYTFKQLRVRNLNTRISVIAQSARLMPQYNTSFIVDDDYNFILGFV